MGQIEFNLMGARERERERESSSLHKSAREIAHAYMYVAPGVCNGLLSPDLGKTLISRPRITFLSQFAFGLGLSLERAAGN